jgi:hypothetical protein
MAGINRYVMDKLLITLSAASQRLIRARCASSTHPSAACAAKK